MELGLFINSVFPMVIQIYEKRTKLLKSVEFVSSLLKEKRVCSTQNLTRVKMRCLSDIRIWSIDAP